MITFPRVWPVKSGDPITSNNLTELARALNARLRSGLGDPTYRLAYYLDSLFRQIRNPDADGYLWPSRSEFMETYQHIHPSQFTYPTAGIGEPEGANVTCVGVELVTGSEATGTFPEDERTADRVPLWLGLNPPSNPAERWQLAKQQRGAVDPESGTIGCPAFDAAREHYQIVRSLFGPHGNSYGGFVPTPAVLIDGGHPDGTCGDGDSDTTPSLNYDIFFTALREVVRFGTTHAVGDQIHYEGTCFQEHEHIAFLYTYPPFGYVVGTWVNNGVDPVTTNIEILSFQDWLLGPFSGGNTLSKQSGDHLPRVLNYFSAQFRGTPLQRAEPGTWLKNAFDTQQFFESQYMLAPARGTQVGDAIEPVYPSFELYGATNYAAGTRLRTTIDDSTTYTVQTGFVVASVYFQVTQLASEETQLDVLVGTDVVATVTLTQEDPTDVVVLGRPVEAGKEISIRITTATELEDATQESRFYVELAELMEYKPWPHDHMLILRLGSCRLDLHNGTDGSGIDEVGSRELGEDYFRWGMALNLRDDPGPAGSFDAINTNALFEAARKMSRCVRILRRHHLVGYEVVDGKSILYLDRWTYGQGGNAPEYDSTGAPALNEVFTSQIVDDAQYIVKASPGSGITYHGDTYENNETFRGTSGDADFTAFGDGRLYLVTRYLADSGFHGASGDVLDGVAPSPFEIPSGSLIWGRSYIVIGAGGVVYGGRNYNENETFIATEKQIEYLANEESKVYEANGIRHLAEPQGFSNEWLVGFQFKAYHTSESSVWKTDAFADYFSFSERCAFYPNPGSATMLGTAMSEARRHFAYGSRFWLAPETVTGYRFAKDLNKVNCDGNPDEAGCIASRLRFYKSCRLYEPDVEIEKSELVWEAGVQRVKLTLTGRVHHHEDAPASLARDPSGWDVDALRLESYRTTENALREYIVNQALGINCIGGELNGGHQTGNSAYDSTVWDLADNPFGTCYPSIFLTQLIPEPYQDTNTTQDLHDTPFLHDQLVQSEMYIRAMCEGYVDGLTTQRYGCEAGIEAMFDYTFEALCFDAFNNRWFPPMPSLATDLLKEPHVRPDFPKGHGPLPNTFAAAEVFNQFAAAVNKLDKVRVMLPYKFEIRTVTGEAQSNVSAWYPDGATTRDCEPSPGFPGVYWKGVPPNPSATVFGTWADDVGADAGVEAKLKVLDTIPSTYDCSGTSWIIITKREDSEFRWKLSDPDAINAIPLAWRDMLETHGGYLAKYEESEETQFIIIQADGSDCFSADNWWNISIGQSLSFDQNTPTTVSRCEIWSNSGRISAPALGTQVLPGGWVPGDTNGACIYPAGNNATLTPYTNDGILMQIPVV